MIARIAIYGDIHLNSKNYGAHKDYPKESLEYFSKITEVVRNRRVTHLIGCGDFSFSRFHSNDFRLAVERQLEEQYKLVNGNRYELKGNHDSATYGLTEREFYVERGLLKPSTNLTLGNLHVTMVDNGEYENVVPNISLNPGDINLMVTHDFFKFKDTRIANYGKAVELDNMSKWFGADYIICGHVHKIMAFNGIIHNQDNTQGHEATVHYLGCMTRPAYREGYMDEVGQILILTVHDDGRLEYDIEEIKLWDLAESFNLDVKEKEKKVKEEKQNRIDISDIVQQLNSHERNVGNPEDIISSMVGLDERYKIKAIKLLKEAQG